METLVFVKIGRIIVFLTKCRIFSELMENIHNGLSDGKPIMEQSEHTYGEIKTQDRLKNVRLLDNAGSK